MRTKFAYAGNQLIYEERCDENNIPYFGDDLVAGDNLVEGDGIIVDSINKSVLEYLYGHSGIEGFVYNGAKHYFRRNVQGDVTRIYAIDGSLTACYTYDAWGNCKVYDAYGNENTDIGFIGNVNPYRYRGYYYDVETKLYYCESRYYDPEVGRWINADDISYIDPETINGLNLYSYCGNNPVMNVDPNGNSWDSFWNKAGKWFKKNWQWVAGAVIIVGLGIAVIATGGAAAGVAGFIVAGAFKGAVITV